MDAKKFLAKVSVLCDNERYCELIDEIDATNVRIAELKKTFEEERSAVMLKTLPPEMTERHLNFFEKLEKLVLQRYEDYRDELLEEVCSIQTLISRHDRQC
ncbi:MAG: hypothetical protein IKO90_00910 [Bacteroidales bacterium]|nr:hypothetical protein [Bacteroidales bacterium]MBR7035292.1 hypothetical protein [Bacteroidales bacterium]